MQRPPLGELTTMETGSNTTAENMTQLLQSCNALHAVSSNSPPNNNNNSNNNAYNMQNTNGSSLIALQPPRKIQPNTTETNNNSLDVNDENAGPKLLQHTGGAGGGKGGATNNKLALRADLNQLAVLRRSRAPTMSRRNERERNRVRYLNFTFDVLRQHLPREHAGAVVKGKAKKMSKVDTLRGAIDYIHDLQDVLGIDVEALAAANKSASGPGGNEQSGSSSSSLSEADSSSPRGSPGDAYGANSSGEGGMDDHGSVTGVGGAAGGVDGMSDQEDCDAELTTTLAGWLC